MRGASVINEDLSLKSENEEQFSLIKHELLFNIKKTITKFRKMLLKKQIYDIVYIFYYEVKIIHSIFWISKY